MLNSHDIGKKKLLEQCSLFANVKRVHDMPGALMTFLPTPMHLWWRDERKFQLRRYSWFKR